MIVAVTVIPFRIWKIDSFVPLLTSNMVPSGTLYCLLPSGRVNIRPCGGLTCQTFPEIVRIVWTVFGVVVVVIVRVESHAGLQLVHAQTFAVHGHPRAYPGH